MSTYYEFFLEINVDDKWHCACPEFPVIAECFKNKKVGFPDCRSRFAPFISGYSSLRDFVDEIELYRISFRDLSKELLEDLFSEETIKSFSETDEDNNPLDMSLLYVVEPNELVRISKDIKDKNYDMSGLVTFEQAKVIDLGKWNGDIYPVHMSEVIEELSEFLSEPKKSATKLLEKITPSLIDKFYARREWIQDGGVLYYKKKLIKEIDSILGMINESCGLWRDDEISLAKCRVIISVA